MPDEKAVNWVRETFSEDIIKLRENSGEVEYIQTLPPVEFNALNLLTKYYCNIDNIASAPKGVGFRGSMKVCDVAVNYEEVILDDSIPSVPEKLKRMIEQDENSGDVHKKGNFYFKYFLDKITNPNFNDYRKIFHLLDKEYREGNDYEAGLKRIYKEYDEFKLIIYLKSKEKSPDSPVKKYVWNPAMQRMVEVLESTGEIKEAEG